MPPAEQVRDTLEKILTSEVFARSGRARDLLKYIVEQDLAGNADRLKGFSIAIDVFGKPQDFDPSTDPLVRVQAGRLREFLTQYYDGPGVADTLRISIPRGSYVPEYSQPASGRAVSTPPVSREHGEHDRQGSAPDPNVMRPASPAAVESGERASTPVAAGDDASFGGSATHRNADNDNGRIGRQLKLMAGGLALVFFLVVLVAFQSMVWESRTADVAEMPVVGSPVGLGEQTGTVPYRELPSVYLSAEVASEAGERVANALRRGLTAFDTVNLIARAPTLGDRRAHLRTDYAFSLRELDGPDNLYLEVQNVVSGRVLFSQSIGLDGLDVESIDDKVADILTTVATASGIIYAHIRANGTQTDLIRCFTLTEDFYRDQKPETYIVAYECLERLVDGGTHAAQAHAELASLHIHSIVNSYDYERSPEQALEHAREAIRLGPNSPSAHRAMGYVLSRTSSAEEALRWTRKAYELNTFDLGMAASFGFALIFAADYEQATPILRRAVLAASAHPTWWDYYLFLGQFMTGDLNGAADTVTALASSPAPHYLAVRLISAHTAGEDEQAAQLADTLLTEHAIFAADPRAYFVRSRYPQDLTDRLSAALHAAGLGGAS